MATGQQLGEYFEYATAEALKSIYGITSNHTDLTKEAERLKLATDEINIKNRESKNLASNLKTILDKEYPNQTPIDIRIVGPNPKTRRYFTSLNVDYDDSNPSDLILKFIGVPKEKEYFGISLKSTSRGKATVKANIGLTEFMKLFGNPQKTENAADFLYNKFAKIIVDARKEDIIINYEVNYGLNKTPKDYFSKKWFNKSFVASLNKGKNLFQNDAKQIKQNYVNYIETQLKNVSQDNIKKFIIEVALKEVSLPLYVIGKSSGGTFQSFNTEKILKILNSTILIDTKSTPSGETRIQIKEQYSANYFIQIRVKYESQQDMTSSIKIEIT
jgi:hypothetical protein